MVSRRSSLPAGELPVDLGLGSSREGSEGRGSRSSDGDSKEDGERDRLAGMGRRGGGQGKHTGGGGAGCSRSTSLCSSLLEQSVSSRTGMRASNSQRFRALDLRIGERRWDACGGLGRNWLHISRTEFYNHPNNRIRPSQFHMANSEVFFIHPNTTLVRLRIISSLLPLLTYLQS